MAEKDPIERIPSDNFNERGQIDYIKMYREVVPKTVQAGNLLDKDDAFAAKARLIREYIHNPEVSRRDQARGDAGMEALPPLEKEDYFAFMENIDVYYRSIDPDEYRKYFDPIENENFYLQLFKKADHSLRKGVLEEKKSYLYSLYQPLEELFRALGGLAIYFGGYEEKFYLHVLSQKIFILIGLIPYVLKKHDEESSHYIVDVIDQIERHISSFVPVQDKELIIEVSKIKDVFDQIAKRCEESG